MAAAPDQGSYDHATHPEADAMSDLQHYEDHQQHELQSEDGTYQEVISTQHIPIKGGDDDEMHVDSDRPGTAGTGHSTQLDEDEENFLKNSAVTGSNTNDFRATLLSRPDQPSGSDGPSPFMLFKPPSKQNLDFQGTRVFGNQSAAVTQQRSGRSNGEEEGTDMNANAETPTFQAAQDVQPTANTLPDTFSSPVQQTDAQTKAKSGAKKSKKNRMKRHHTMSARQPNEAIFTASISEDAQAAQQQPLQADTSRLQQPPIEDLAHQQQPLPLDANEDHFEDAPEDFFPANDEQVRPVTPPFDPMQLQADQQAQPSSPHGQLQGDLETTIQQGGFIEHANSPDAIPVNPDVNQQHVQRQSAQPQESQAASTGVTGQLNGHALQRVTPPAKPVKQKKSKSSRKASAPARCVSNTNAVSDSDINDYMQMLIWKVREQCQHTINNVTAERDAIQQDLKQRLETMQTLQNELYQTQQDKDGLSAACDKQKSQLASYEAKVKKFKTFVDGLGRDVDSLKRDANANRRKGEELIQEGSDRRSEHEQLMQQVNNCAERSSQLKNEALKACAETQSELEAEKMRAGYLDKQLSEKVGLLAEERDRRAQLERRLLSVADPSDSVIRAIKANHDALLDKLHLMHAALETTEANGKMSDMLKQTLGALQAVNSQTNTNAEEAAHTKGLVESLNERLSELNDHDSTEPLKKQLDEVLTGLKGVADHQGDRIRQEAAHKEAVSGLQEKIKRSNVRIANIEGELQLAQSREGEFKEANEKLQSRLTAMQNQPNASAGSAQAQMNEAKIELQAKVRALEMADSNLAKKTAELEALRKTTKGLQTTMNSLRENIQELEQTKDNLMPAKAAADEHLHQEMERVREEARKNSEEYRAQLEMEQKNQIRKLTSDRDRYEKQVTPLKADLINSKKHAEELQKKVAEGTATREQLEQKTKLARIQAKEIEDLKTSLRDLQQSANIDASMKKKLAGLSTDLEKAKAKLQEAIEEKIALHKKADGYLHQSTEASKTSEQLRAELATYRADAENRVEKLNETLKEAQEARRRAEAGREHLRKSCDATIDEEAAKGRRQLEDLQISLAQAREEVEKQKTDAEDFRAETEKQWQLETDGHAQKLDDLRGEIEQANAAKDEALASNERSIEERQTLLEQVNVLKQRLASMKEKLSKQQESQAQAVDTSSRLTEPSLSERLTPAGSVRSTQPTRPRKKVDHNYNSTLDASALPAPEVLRPDSRRTGSSKSKTAAAEPVIEESQVAETQLSARNAGAATSSGPKNFAMFSDSDCATQATQCLQSQPRMQVVEETQFESLPSFAASNRTFSNTQTPVPNLLSSSLSMAYNNDTKTSFNSSHRAGLGQSGSSVPHAGATHATHPPGESFSIYEDSQDNENQAPKQSRITPAAYSQDVVDWSQEERDKYTFRKKMPQPNSASKLVRNDSQSSVGSKSRNSGLQDRAPLRERKLDTPEVRGETARSSNSSLGHSSSPAYAQPTSTRLKRTYSNTPGGSAKRKSSRTLSITIRDPRLEGRNPAPAPAPKRRAETQVVEGYEPERKKRLSAVVIPSSDASRFSLQSQQSLRDLPSFPTMPANPKRSSSQSRLRTLGGGSSRAPGSKKMSKADEFGARFSQELGRR